MLLRSICRWSAIFVTVLRIPYAYLYPLIIMFCIIGVYEVKHSVVDVWIMLIMGILGYALRKFEFDPAPLVLGLVISRSWNRVCGNRSSCRTAIT